MGEREARCLCPLHPQIDDVREGARAAYDRDPMPKGWDATWADAYLLVPRSYRSGRAGPSPAESRRMRTRTVWPWVAKSPSPASMPVTASNV